MCLDLPTPGYSTVSFVTNGVVYEIGWEEIQPGDLIGHMGEGTGGNGGHVRVYKGRTPDGGWQWYEQAVGSTGPDLTTASEVDTDWYRAYRFVDIEEDGMGFEEWSASNPDAQASWALTQGSEGYAGHQRDTALAFTWESANNANNRLSRLEPVVALASVAAILGAVFSALAYLPEDAATWAVPAAGVLGFIAIVSILVYIFTNRYGTSPAPPMPPNDRTRLVTSTGAPRRRD
jgi:hypothetical protein